MVITEPIYDVMIEYGKTYQARIVFHQHDGMTVSFSNKDRKDCVIKKMQEAVAKNAMDKFGITMKLEVIDL